MLKHYIILASLFTSVAYSAEKAVTPVETEKKIVCFPAKTLLKDLKDKYGEEPMILGITTNMDDVAMGVYINKETGSYTVIEFDTEAACVVSIGKNIRYRFPKSQSML